MYPPHHFGGYELLWRSAMEHLRAKGHEVLVLTTDFRHPSPDPAIPEAEYVRRDLRWYWREHDWPRMSPAERVRLERHNGRVLEEAMGDLEPDVVNWWAMGGMSLSLIERVRRAGLPSVGVVGDVWMLYGPRVDGWIRSVQRLGPLAPLAGRLAGVPATYDLREIPWLFMSDFTRRHCEAEGIRLDRADVAHPGVDPAFFAATDDHEWAWRLLYVGRIDERKGIDAAVEALARAARGGDADRARVGRRRVPRRVARARRTARRPRASGVRVATARRAARCLRGSGCAAVPHPLGRALGTRAARGDVVRNAGGGHRDGRLRRVPARSGERSGRGPSTRRPRRLPKPCAAWRRTAPCASACGRAASPPRRATPRGPTTSASPPR